MVKILKIWNIYNQKTKFKKCYVKITFPFNKNDNFTEMLSTIQE